jgi:predicted secreted protein
MEMAIQLAKFYMGQVRLMHANADDESLPTHIVKVLELSKRLDTYSESGWIKAKNIQDMFTGKKRPSAQVARDWMNEAVALGFGQTRGKGNRLEYHWHRDNNDYSDDSPSPSNLGNLGNSWGTLKEDVPQVETTLNQDFQENLRNLRKDSLTFQVVVEEENLTEDIPPQMESPPPENDLEGGSLPNPSPTLPQERCEAEYVGVSDLGNNLRNPSLTLPQVPQVCDSSAQVVTVIAIAPTTPAEQDESILDLAEILTDADKASLREIRRTAGITPSMLNQACKRLDEGKRTEIRGWVDELNQENEDLKIGKVLGRKARIRNLKGEISNEAWQIVKWCDRNEIYTLENGEKCYPHQLVLVDQ